MMADDFSISSSRRPYGTFLWWFPFLVCCRVTWSFPRVGLTPVGRRSLSWPRRPVALLATPEPHRTVPSAPIPPPFLGRSSNRTFWESAIRGPPPDSKPDYDTIVGPLGRTMDRLFLVVFRRALAHHAQLDSHLPVDDYQGIIDIATRMNRRYSDRHVVQAKALLVLQSLFPSWLPGAYAKLFAEPFPNWSARMNAWATKVAGTWLMGECEINHVIIPTSDGQEMVGHHQGLKVHRCRFLEEAGCASVCVNSCKIPTQTFFREHMGLALTMEPNYETFECQFSFGRLPTEEEELQARDVPCLMRCPSVGTLRQQHAQNGSADGRRRGNVETDQPPCALMWDPTDAAL